MKNSIKWKLEWKVSRRRNTRCWTQGCKNTTPKHEQVQKHWAPQSQKTLGVLDSIFFEVYRTSNMCDQNWVFLWYFIISLQKVQSKETIFEVLRENYQLTYELMNLNINSLINNFKLQENMKWCISILESKDWQSRFLKPVSIF